eukprot:TRINITY_DN18352_c0_g1_i1.p1 TRINITY_DN18352_c0_g1~~TRINITY_DN18352_c0_g1_i1.p1  ORF type:complete len:730 (-),score=180.11 TRINITY_DN18352_c0_g1_i1:56-2245(-)
MSVGLKPIRRSAPSQDPDDYPAEISKPMPKLAARPFTPSRARGTPSASTEIARPTAKIASPAVVPPRPRTGATQAVRPSASGIRRPPPQQVPPRQQTQNDDRFPFFMGAVARKRQLEITSSPSFQEEYHGQPNWYQQPEYDYGQPPPPPGPPPAKYGGYDHGYGYNNGHGVPYGGQPPAPMQPQPRPPAGPPPSRVLSAAAPSSRRQPPMQSQPSWQQPHQNSWQQQPHQNSWQQQPHQNSWQQQPQQNSWQSTQKKKSTPQPPEESYHVEHKPLDECVRWLEIDESSSLVQEGYPAMAPAVLHDASLQHLMSSANNLMYDLAADKSGDVVLVNDPDWSEFPQVGEAVKASGFEEIAQCVATCQSTGKYAVGLATQKKKREQAAKLALCIALAADADSLQDVCSKHEGFVDLCDCAGINVEDVPRAPKAPRQPQGPPPARKPPPARPPQTSNGHANKRPRVDYTAEAVQPMDDLADMEAADAEEAAALAQAEADAQAEAEAFAAEEAERVEAESRAQAAAEAALQAELDEANSFEVGPSTKTGSRTGQYGSKPQNQSGQNAGKQQYQYDSPSVVPRDTPIWIQLSTDAELGRLEGLEPQGLVVATEGNARKGLYSQADGALESLLGDMLSEVEYIDDPEWSQFPVVGAALKELAEKEECLVVAICPTRALWAVGVGMKGKNRWMAVKVALAALVGIQEIELGEELPDLSQASAISDFMEEATSARESLV